MRQVITMIAGASILAGFLSKRSKDAKKDAW
jgi:hypothetical protein